jgi:hypothetical protein
VQTEELLKNGKRIESQNGSQNGTATVETVTVELRTTGVAPSPLETLAARPAETDPREPNGGIAAALLSAGVACALFGLIVVLTEANTAVADFATFFKPTGDLSGKTTLTVIAWIVLWPVLHWRLRHKDVDLKKAVRATWVFVAIGLLGTFPPFYQMVTGIFNAGG